MGSPTLTDRTVISEPAGPSSPELRQLWFATQRRRKWSSLVVIPAAPATSARMVAAALAEVGGLATGTPILMLDAEGLELSQTSNVILEMTTRVAAGGLVVVAVDSVLRNQAGIPLALAADAALLYVELGASRIDDARRTIELIGAEHIMGTVTREA